jgi:hypothetical protein
MRLQGCLNGNSTPTRHHAVRYGWGSALSLTLWCSVGCGDGDDPADADASTVEVAVGQQALGYPANTQLHWPDGTVPYCYQPSPPVTGHPQPGTTPFNQTLAIMEKYIAQYEAVPDAHIDFQGGALCPDWDDYVIGSDPDTLRILITTDDAAMRSCDPGSSIALGQSFEDFCDGVFDATRETLIAYGKDHGESAAIHELAHALWFRHEYLRRSDGCNPNATTPVADGITAYDFYGVGNATYCHWRTELSNLDQVGLAFVYPGATADRLLIPRSFRLPNSVMLTASENGVAIEFAQRVAGVEPYHYSGAQWLKSTSSGSTQIATGSSVSLGTLFGSSSEAILRGQFTDFLGRVRTTPYTTFRRNRSQFSALVMSTISFH